MGLNLNIGKPLFPPTNSFPGKLNHSCRKVYRSFGRMCYVI